MHEKYVVDLMNFLKRHRLASALFLIGIISIFTLMFSDRNGSEIAIDLLKGSKRMAGGQEQFTPASAAPQVSNHLWDTLLQKHVDDFGLINYQGVMRDSVAFNAYLTELQLHPPGMNWSRDEKMAFWINAYNAFTVKLIIDHYPVQSIKDIAGSVPFVNSPWDIAFIPIGQQMLDLNTIEHDILRAEFNEPRIHFAINCASISCPVLRNEAYAPEQLDQQLEEQTYLFINESTRNKITADRVELSMIFQWFQSDFTNEKTLEGFINQYASPQIGSAARIRFLEYNWQLNQSKGNTP
jgi:hypothetical protein